MTVKNFIDSKSKNAANVSIVDCVASFARFVEINTKHGAAMYEIKKKKELYIRKIEKDGDMQIKGINAHCQIVSTALGAAKLSSAQKRDIVLEQIERIF